MLIPQAEVEAARIRVAAKRTVRRQERDAKKVKLKIVYNPYGLGQIGTLAKADGTIVRRAIIHGGTQGDYKIAKDFIQAMKDEGWEIINLPNANDNRFYVRQLFAMGGTSLGVLLEAGVVKHCYTLDDLLEAGFIDRL